MLYVLSFAAVGDSGTINSASPALNPSCLAFTSPCCKLGAADRSTMGLLNSPALSGSGRRTSASKSMLSMVDSPALSSTSFR